MGSYDSAAADLLAAPLTHALAKLSGHEEDKGRHLRPENYSQGQLKDKQRDYSKLDTIDLFHGWICVLENLYATGGDFPSYIGHVKYMTGMLQSRKFFDAGASSYDRLILDKYLTGKVRGFEPDPVLASLSFSTQVIPDNMEICHGGSLTKGVTSYVKKASASVEVRGNPRNRMKFHRTSPQKYAFTTTIVSVTKTSAAGLTFVENVLQNTELILAEKSQKSLELSGSKYPTLQDWRYESKSQSLPQ